MKNKLLTIAIILLAIVARVYNLQNYPPLLWDEAALGYNAYSILKTGKDEHGQLLPLVFKSFGDYKPGLYVYLSLPFIATLGLTETSIRLVSVLSGLLIVILLYKITNSHWSLILSATTPWLIHYSRGAWETNLSAALFLLAYYLHKHNKPLPASILLALNLYTYQSAKLISLCFLIYFLVSNLKSYKKILLPFAFCSLPILYGLIFGNDANRLQVVSLFSYKKDITSPNIFDNQIIFFLRGFFGRYFNHFSPYFLFTQGDWQNPRHSAPYTGLFLLQVITLIPGIFKYFTNKLNSADKFFLLWLVIAAIPSALTRDQISATRALGLSIPMVYFLSQTISLYSHKFKLIFTILLFIFFFYYLDLYHNHMVKKSPEQWLYGYKEVVQRIHAKTYDNIFVTNYYNQPYIFYLFYSQYDPSKIQQNVYKTFSSLDSGNVYKIDNIVFDSVNFSGRIEKPNSLLIMANEEVIRQGIDKSRLEPIGVIGPEKTMFFAYETK